MRRKIETSRHLRAALDRLDELWSVRPGQPDWEERCALADAIEQFEERHFEPTPPSPIDAIRFRMEQGGLRDKDLIPYFGSASRVSEVLSGKRRLSKEMIRRLHVGLGIPLASLHGIESADPSAGVPHVEVSDTPSYCREDTAISPPPGTDCFSQNISFASGSTVRSGCSSNARIEAPRFSHHYNRRAA